MNDELSSNSASTSHEKSFKSILKRLEELKTTEVKVIGGRHSGKSFAAGYAEGIREAINIITQELGGTK